MNPGIGPAPIQERCPQIPVFQADGTVSKIESFRGDCKGRIEDFGGNRRIKINPRQNSRAMEVVGSQKDNEYSPSKIGQAI